MQGIHRLRRITVEAVSAEKGTDITFCDNIGCIVWSVRLQKGIVFFYPLHDIGKYQIAVVVFSRDLF